MKINDCVNNETLTINDYMSAYREAKSRMDWYAKKGIETIKVMDGDTIIIRRKNNGK